MKAIVQRFLMLLKSLFLKLRVVVTLQLGKGKVNKAGDEVDVTERNSDES